jgi:hypothetical protein
MSDKIFSRAYLQGRPLEHKRKEVSKLISIFQQALLSAADSGSTSYLFDMTNTDYISQITQPDNMKQTIHIRTSFTNPSYSMPIDEIIPLFQERFPDCTITYQELMVDTKFNFKVPQKGILIDWS